VSAEIGNRMLLTATTNKDEDVAVQAYRDCPLTSEEIKLRDVWKDSVGLSLPRKPNENIK
jgi:hypothetical protein